MRYETARATFWKKFYPWEDKNAFTKTAQYGRLPPSCTFGIDRGRRQSQRVRKSEIGRKSILIDNFFIMETGRMDFKNSKNIKMETHTVNQVISPLQLAPLQ